MMRFIGVEENDGARWSVGDTLDLFVLDYKNIVVTPNDGFELANAVHLSVVGATLLAVVLM